MQTHFDRLNRNKTRNSPRQCFKSVSFNIFINDIGTTLSTDDAPIVYDSKVNHLLYADDLVLMSTTEEGLQRNIDMVNEYCTKWGLAVNTDKSKVMTFSKTGRMLKDRFKFVFWYR